MPRVARELDIKRINRADAASVLSAWGMLTSDLRYEVSRPHYGAGARISAAEVRALFAQLEHRRPAGFAPGSMALMTISALGGMRTASRYWR